MAQIITEQAWKKQLPENSSAFSKSVLSCNFAFKSDSIVIPDQRLTHPKPRSGKAFEYEETFMSKTNHLHYTDIKSVIRQNRSTPIDFSWKGWKSESPKVSANNEV